MSLEIENTLLENRLLTIVLNHINYCCGCFLLYNNTTALATFKTPVLTNVGTG